MRVVLAAVSATLLMASGNGHAINKCTDPAGKVVYQDMPCPDNAKSRSIEATKTNRNARTDQSPTAGGLTPGEKKLLRAAELREAERDGIVLAGMDRAAVLRILGEPSKVNATKRGNTIEEQWVYRARVPCRGYTDEYTMYVYLKDSIVTSKTEHVSCSR